jgi:hypothetical protein
MLRVEYTPEGGNLQRWMFDADAVDVVEAERIEATMGSGATWDDFVRGLVARTARARRVLLWHLINRDHPGARIAFSDTPVFKMGELEVHMGVAELVALRDDVEANERITPERKRRTVAELEREISEAAIAEAMLDQPEAAGAELVGPKEEQPVMPDPVMPDVSTAPALSAKSAKRSPPNSPRSAPRRRTSST